MKRDLYYVYRVGHYKVLGHIYAKTLCTPFEIRKYVDYLTATDKFGFTYIALKQECYMSTDGIKVVLK